MVGYFIEAERKEEIEDITKQTALVKGDGMVSATLKDLLYELYSRPNRSYEIIVWDKDTLSTLSKTTDILETSRLRVIVVHDLYAKVIKDTKGITYPLAEILKDLTGRDLRTDIEGSVEDLTLAYEEIMEEIYRRKYGEEEINNRKNIGTIREREREI